MNKVGIFSGTFDPVHSGHIAFALQAMSEANLDYVYFMPEIQTKNKIGVVHYGHRVAMLKRALSPHPKLKILETHHINFTIANTWPLLKKNFKDAKLYFLFGSDHYPELLSWPNIVKLTSQSGLIIGIRKDDQVRLKPLINLAKDPDTLFINSYLPLVSSSDIRLAINTNKNDQSGLLSSVSKYCNKNWLYVSFK